MLTNRVTVRRTFLSLLLLLATLTVSVVMIAPTAQMDHTRRPANTPRGRVFFLAKKDSLRPGVAFFARKKGNFNRRLICFFFCNKEIPESNNGKTTIFYRKARSGLFFLHHSLILFSFGRFAQISETFLFLSLILL